MILTFVKYVGLTQTTQGMGESDSEDDPFNSLLDDMGKFTGFGYSSSGIISYTNQQYLIECGRKMTMSVRALLFLGYLIN